MKKKRTARATLQYMIKTLTFYLSELSAVNSVEGEQFLYGEKTAYAECLEIIQLWARAAANGLDFDVEMRYPL